MTLKKARLLILGENADYRTYFSKAVFDTVSGTVPLQAPSLPTSLPTQLHDCPNAVDLHVLSAAAYWRSLVQEVAILSLYTPTSYSEVSPLGVRLIGSGLVKNAAEGAAESSAKSALQKPEATKHELIKDEAGDRERIRLVADFCPTHIVFCTPTYAVLSWANRNRIPSMVLFSNWQEPLGLKARWQHGRLINQLNHDSVSWVGSQGAYACKVLEASGISPRKLIPWIWPQTALPKDYPAKQLRYDHTAITLVYAAPAQPTAGTGDLLQAVCHLRKKGTAIHLLIVSNQLISNAPETTDNIPFDQALTALQHQVARLKLSDCTTIIPALSRTELTETIRAADLVVMPDFEGDRPAATSAILVLAMAARTPVVAADHRSLKEHLLHGVNAMVYPAGNAKSMAHRIERVMSQPQLYNQLSEALETPLNALKVPAQWAKLIDLWLKSDRTMSAGADNYQRLCNWAFSSGRYQAIFSQHSVAGVSSKKQVRASAKKLSSR